jgi:hypothetical protein
MYNPAMFGFNATGSGNIPRDPLQDRVFNGTNGWWFHGHMGYPPHPTDFIEFPAGGFATVELVCDKGASSYWRTNPG